jgi:hypothetical protein
MASRYAHTFLCYYFIVFLLLLPHWLPQDLAVLVLLHWPRLVRACAQDLAVLVLLREPPLFVLVEAPLSYLMVMLLNQRSGGTVPLTLIYLLYYSLTSLC